MMLILSPRFAAMVQVGKLRRNRSKFSAVCLFAIFALFLQVGELAAQTGGSVVGVTLDPSGAAVPGASLELRSGATGEARSTTSANNGDFNFPFVEAGTYDLTATKGGFATVVVSGLVVRVNSPLRQDISFKLASVAQELNVSANPVALNTEDPSLGGVIESKMIAELPLNGRDFMQLATLGAGVSPPATQNFGSSTQAFGGGRPTLTVSISGSREISPSFLFDGVPSRHDYYGAVGLEPPVDSITEFRIQQGYFSPQFGSPGVINVVLKSGTNSIHGAAWEFLRNDILDAKNYFDVAGKPPYRQNQFGINAGGPILKNKLFWFADYEGLRISQGATGYAIVPTQEMLAGNFSGMATIYDPSTYDPVTQTRQPFPNNQIPKSEISSFAQIYNQFVPAPNTAPIASLGGVNYVGHTQHLQDDDKFDVKITYAPSERDTFFGEFNFINSGESDTSILPYNGSSSPLTSRHPVLGWTHVFSPNIVNDFRAGLDRVFLSTQAPEKALSSPNWATTLGFTNLNGVQQCNAVPSVGLSGFANFGFAFANCIITGNSDYHFIDNVSYNLGRHTLTAGAHLERHYLHDLCVYAQDGAFSFTGQYTNSGLNGDGGSSIADYLLGAPFSATGTKFPGAFYRTGWWPEAYVNDNFKVKPNLTVNLGLRYQFNQPLVEKHNNLTQFNYQTGQVVTPATPGYPRALLASRRLDFAPRVGFAYSPRNTTAIHASFGLFYDRLPGNEWSFQTTDPPVEEGFSFAGDPFLPTINLGTLFPSVLPSTTGIALFNLGGVNGSFNRGDPYLDQWTFSVEQTIPGNMLATLAYVGSKGTHLSKRLDTNLDPSPPAPGDDRSTAERSPYPNFGFILDDRGIGNSEYNALQASLKKEFSHNLTFMSAYTWGRSMDNDSFDTKATRNYRNSDPDHGRSAFDLRERFVTSVVYALPFYMNRGGFRGEALGGWQVAGIVSLQTGLPFEVLTYADPSNTGVIFGARPNRSCDGNLPRGQQTPERWFDTNCFSMPAQDTYGNGRTGYLNTNGYKNLDLTVSKTFKLFEKTNMQFRSEFFNVLNNVNFDEPGAYLDGGGFGVVSGAQPARIIQFGLKLER